MARADLTGDPSFSLLSQELREIYDSVRDRAAGRIESLAFSIDHEGRFSRDLWDQVVDLGVLAAAFPDSLGGVGLSAKGYVVALEALATTSALAAMYSGTTAQVGKAIARFGSDDVRHRWLDRIVAGDAICSWAFTEPQTGSDPRQITTEATRTADGWLLNGAKQFISFAAVCDLAVVFARTDEGLGAFLVDPHQPGWTVGPTLPMAAFRGAGTAPVYLENVEVPADQLLGGPGDGFAIMLAVEAEGKLRAAATNVGIAQRALEESVEYATQRLHRGQAIGDKFPSIQLLIGQAAADVAAAGALVWNAADAQEAGLDLGPMAAMARITTGRAARETTNAALQVCGAYGYTQEMVVERLYREAKFYEVAQGVVELQKIIVARTTLKGSRA